jgi:hypothetical protein
VVELLCIKIARSKTAVVTADILIMIASGVANKVFEAHGSKEVVLWSVCTARADVGLSVERVRLTLLQLSVNLQPSALSEDNGKFLPGLPNRLRLVKTDNWTT